MYGHPEEQQIDLLEVYAYSDSRLTEQVRSNGGSAKRFTQADGDLAPAAGQRALFDYIQKCQPRHIWVSPEYRLWGSWSRFNASRVADGWQRLNSTQQQDLVHVSLCARLFRYQAARGRHFHLEQPEGSQMLEQSELSDVIAKSFTVVTDMCAFGLKTPVTHEPIRKRTKIVTTNESLARMLESRRCPATRMHRQVAGQIGLTNGRSMRTSHFAASYCIGFARCVARFLVSESQIESANANAEEVHRTRKRFKTPSGQARFQSELRSHKRSVGNSSAGQARGAPRARQEGEPSESSQLLSPEDWRDFFSMTASSAPHHGNILINPESPVVQGLNSRLPEFEVLQMFLGKDCKSLCLPVGALPSNAAPFRISSTQRDGPQFYQYGLRMPADRSRRRIPTCELLSTALVC